MNTAFVFPGQGSQSVGMGKELSEKYSVAKDVFNRVDDVLGQNLSKVIFEGPIEDLTLTHNTQPALMATSMAFLSVIMYQTGKNIGDLCKFVAGHSVGEYAALAAAGSISIEDAAKILRLRGNAMQESCPKGEGAMAAILGLSIEGVEEIAKSADGICDIANDNSLSQIVISGDNKGIDFAVAKAKEEGGKGIKLNVSGPFHSRLMANAEEIMKVNLESVEIKEPNIPVILNVTANQSVSPDEIKKSLIAQVSGRVRWRETISYFANNGITRIVEIGSGKVLNGMLKRESHNFELINVGNIPELEEFLNSIS